MDAHTRVSSLLMHILHHLIRLYLQSINSRIKLLGISGWWQWSIAPVWTLLGADPAGQAPWVTFCCCFSPIAGVQPPLWSDH